MPDPDGPWSPTASHGHAWIFAVFIEAVICGVLSSKAGKATVSSALSSALFGLSISRIALMVIMVLPLAVHQYRLRKEEASSDERQSLLENGNHTSTRYDGQNGTVSDSMAKKRRDAQSSGWFDYLAGFRILFPYLW